MMNLTLNIKCVLKTTTFLIIFVSIIFSVKGYSQNQQLIDVRGVVKDESGFTVPFASVYLEVVRTGTTTTEDGDFSLVINQKDINDVIVINSLGFKTFKIKAQDFINQKEKEIILEDAVVALNEVRILTPKDYVLRAKENLKKTTVSKSHQLNMLYRRASSEEGKARFFIEQYLKVKDRGPSAYQLSQIEVLESRNSADYRFYKKTEHRHSVIPMTVRNPVRHLTSRIIKKTKWKITGNSSYEGEDVVIVEGWVSDEHTNKAILYIGMDTYAIYRADNTSNNSVFIYQKNKEGKLYLSYHTRAWASQEKLTDHLRAILRKSNDVKTIQLTYKHEVFVLGIETEKKKMDIKGQIDPFHKDITLLNIPYHHNFWTTFKAPPETKYFKKIKSELESHFNVPLEVQFNVVNK